MGCACAYSNAYAIFGKLAKVPNIQFSIPLLQVGFPTTQLEFHPLNWCDRWNSNHMCLNFENFLHTLNKQSIQSFKNALVRFLCVFICTLVKSRISLLNIALDIVPFSGERLKKEIASLLNLSSEALPFSRISLNLCTMR